MRIGVHAGHNPDGKVGCGAIGLIKESTEARKVKDEVIRLFRLKGHTVFDCTVDNGKSVSDIVNKQVAKSNAQDLDITVSIHFNAGSPDRDAYTTGTEVLMNGIEGIKKEVGTRICANISKLGYKNRGLKNRTNLGFLNRTKAKAILVECCFVDDKDDVKLYNYKTMAKAIAEGIHGSSIEENVNVNANVNTSTNTNTNADTTYRVIAGSFKSRKNADAQIEKLKAVGINAFIEVRRS